uniref:Semaphorin 4D n=1 Tax=Pipistrellus kuhlii TaxID=59472 RepID=A0A7J7RT45_PIPKU|nr:semaphorin 4D [Pipistrellus kuhlii]
MCARTGGPLTALAVVFGAAVAFAPIPRITWEHTEVQLARFHQPGIFNYSALLLSADADTLYVGAREAVFAVDTLNVSQKRHEVGPAPALRSRPQTLLLLPPVAHSSPGHRPSPAVPPAPARLTDSRPWAAGPAIRKLPSCCVHTATARVPHILTRNHPFSGVSEGLIGTVVTLHRSRGRAEMDPTPAPHPAPGQGWPVLPTFPPATRSMRL